MAGTVDSPAAALEAWRGEPGIRGGDDGDIDRRHHSQRPRTDGACADRAAHALREMHLLLGAMVSSGGCLRWFPRPVWAGGDPERDRGRRDSYDLLTRQAEGIEPGSAGSSSCPT